MNRSNTFSKVRRDKVTNNTSTNNLLETMGPYPGTLLNRVAAGNFAVSRNVTVQRMDTTTNFFLGNTLLVMPLEKANRTNNFIVSKDLGTTNLYATTSLNVRGVQLV